MRILIAGCGDVGNLLGELATNSGESVWGIRRTVAHLHPSIKPIALDLTKPLTNASLPTHIDRIFYLPTPGRRDRQRYHEVFVQGLENLLNAVHCAAQARLIYVSSTSVYGDDDGSIVGARTPACPRSETAEVLRRGEDLALASGMRTTIVRFSGIYGPGRNRLIERVASASYVADPNKWTNRIHRMDCARVLRHIAALSDASTCYLATDCEAATEGDVFDFIAQQLGHTPQPRKANTQASQFRGKRCVNTELLETGYTFLYPNYRDGYAELVRQYLDNK